MIYESKPQRIPQSRREAYNRRILRSIERNDGSMTREEIFNGYSGLGGLHKLKLSDYNSPYEFSQAKKESEIGQFFTPHDVCRQIVELAAPAAEERVLEMCCGMGNFFNYLPNPYNACGFDVDPNAVAVARHLYPEANISIDDICYYRSGQLFDYLFGNPPFNLDFNGENSQLYYLKKAHEVLAPAALAIVIVPGTFLQDEFWSKSQIKAIDMRFSFIGQTKLPRNAFASAGVDSFETKIMVFSRESEHIESTPYKPGEYISTDILKQRIERFKALKRTLKLKLVRETNHISETEMRVFHYKVKKYLFELKTHAHLRDKYDRAAALVAKFLNQSPSPALPPKEREAWERNKLTPEKVLSVICRYIRRQYEVPLDEVALVRTNYSFKLKAYAPNLLVDHPCKQVSLYRLIAEDCALPDAGRWMNPKLRQQYEQARKVIRRKQKEFKRQSRPFKEMMPQETLSRYIAGQHFYNKQLKKCSFLPLQQQDMNVAFQKRYFLLNWQQGSGKTAVAYQFGKYLRSLEHIRNIVIIAPANAIEMTWEPFLQWQNKLYMRINRPRDLEQVEPGVVVMASLTMLDKFKRPFMRFMKLRSNKVCLVFDESDEITNPHALRTQTMLDIFRRARYKCLATGTTVRNYVTESYSQLELLYNNSVNMRCLCPNIYHEDRETGEIIRRDNPYYGQPFPARGGERLFKACFNPSKASVFGIAKQNQDIYNPDQLRALIDKTIITRSFKEFAGDRYSISSVKIEQGPGEKAVYETILKEFYRICYLYFESSKNERKEAGLRIIRQIKLLIRACSTPNTMIGYDGDEPFPRKTRCIADIIRAYPEKIAVGCTSLEALDMYVDYFGMAFPQRPLFIVHGAIPMKKRKTIIERFENSQDGILLCTQQSLKSSVNIPSCRKVILEALQWNISKMEQFFFRFIRLDSVGTVNVTFVTYKDSIEQNLYALIATKERLTEFMKYGELREQSEIFDELDISLSLIEEMLQRGRDENGKLYIGWGGQKIAA